MDFFNYKQDQLFAEDVNVADIAAQFNTPAYIYSRAAIERHWQAFDTAAGEHPHLVCYAVKANSNLGVLNVMARLGSGFDIVSGGELARVIEAGGDPAKVVFSGVGKTEAEIEYALEAGIYCFNVESEPELDRINKVAAELDKQAPISIRVNPDVDAKTHPYISTGLKANKFGIERERALEVYKYAASLSHLNVQGIDCHIGSQLTEIQPFIDALDKVLALIDELKAAGIAISHLDVGGGLGVTYADEKPPATEEYVAALKAKLTDRADLKLIFEPGRSIMANAGILITKVEFIKNGEEKNFAIVDAAMNDLIRPSLYSAWQNIVPVDASLTREAAVYDVVGPICETGDFLGKDRKLPIAAGDLLAVRSSGAYGFTMASNYNSRVRAVEIMVDGNKPYVVREREQLTDLWKGEQLLP
ncbi:putative diaminopimelate decarboxylase [Catenovulum agarivorans DS-2]|uniref:Diaminopimelate decarboxylase n=1 Tax=Catenovulum agarivorans DS-2 TaxID=1328313 RepID=W7QLB9_9ALTE|nr:diaminopimelate decarboxylase [Catenovulum agarivorans]EWH08933.1 putative diaminopimelate decarboxylase [Catenovulum agarivorans DS-2]